MRNEYGIMLDKNGYAPSIVDYYGQLAERCYLCEWRGDLVRHEIFNGSNRQRSKAYGLWVLLCPRCHMEVHDHPEKYRHMKIVAERQALAYYDWTIDEWIGRFGKNYVEVQQHENRRLRFD